MADKADRTCEVCDKPLKRKRRPLTDYQTCGTDQRLDWLLRAKAIQTGVPHTLFDKDIADRMLVETQLSESADEPKAARTAAAEPPLAGSAPEMILPISRRNDGMLDLRVKK